MFWSASPAAATPGPHRRASLDDATEKATNAAGWVEENWATWLTSALQIALIIVIAVILRHVIRRTITKLIERMNRTATAAQGTALGGFLVNAERRRQRSEAIGSVLRSVASFVIMGTAALTVLSVLKINLAPLLASAGVAGVAIGFGARNLVTDFLSGVFMILEDQYGVGDEIDAGVATGTVVEVGLRVTKLRGPNGAIWYIRNGEVKRIGNLSQGWSTATVDVMIAPNQDLDRARQVITAVGEEMSKAEPWNEQLWEPVEVLGLSEVHLDSVTISVSAKTMPGKALGIERELRWRIKKALDTEGITLAPRPTTPLTDEPTTPDPSAAVAAPSALASPTSPQSLAAAPIPAPNLSK
ncbi:MULTISPECIES: mechanosensitive ion channel family protein [Streptomyces]|uniref:Mechanosensitive ion channel family protein n=3 Tax=Streptomyces rimosus TaxID=1927 RepID=L8EQM5_STRR1|nr:MULTISPECIES: mechanosensitive ion channel family protein [Streptomyces]KOG71899.1 mechanosensitive ion channel protein MscS [Kitasatospora aureofaciens]MYT48638.1 mechanosensitive ion channel [Streptomyces sp. SID5471]KEF06088.1 mechanosensitive ion channel protein MscS [Streptomyces rimosus]KEF19082.1 mechanosensitive ion channel protein MscS [Streptomyces rimosus]KUJ26837.1 mechanosensitive ion channel protein MscS [Streptomyces rimosus subsp. rimosus]